MVWELNNETPTTVNINVLTGGATKVFTFSGEKILKEALREIAKDCALSSVTVKDGMGEEITPSEGAMPLKEFDAPIEVMPKAQGA